MGVHAEAPTAGAWLARVTKSGTRVSLLVDPKQQSPGALPMVLLITER